MIRVYVAPLVVAKPFVDDSVEILVDPAAHLFAGLRPLEAVRVDAAREVGACAACREQAEHEGNEGAHGAAVYMRGVSRHVPRR